MEGRDCLPSQDSSGSIGSQLRNSGSPARGSPAGGHRACPRHSHLARAGRTVARRASSVEWRAAGGAAATRTLSGRRPGFRGRAARADSRARSQPHHAARGPADLVRPEKRDRIMKKLPYASVVCLTAVVACTHRPQTDPNVVTIAVFASPNNFDPRVGTDEVSQKVYQLVYDNLLNLDDELKVAPGLATHWEQPDDRSFILQLRR